MGKLLLMDGHSILSRAFYGVPELTNSKGLHTNAVYGFLNILFKVIEEEQPEYITVAFDVKHPTFRHEMYSEYKGTRKPMPAELHEQVPVLKELLRSMNVTVVEKPGFEADDLLGTMARLAEGRGCNVTIVSGDRDLLQLVTEKVTLRIPKTKAGKTVVEDYTPDKVREVYQLEPKQIIDLKGLMGDSSDNIPGLPGVGEKTATTLLLSYGTVEEVIAHADEVKPKKAHEALVNSPELAVMSKELATIKTDVEIDYELEDAVLANMFNDDSYEHIKELEFKSILSRFDHMEGKDGDNKAEYSVYRSADEVKSACDAIVQEAKDSGYIGMYFSWKDMDVHDSYDGVALMVSVVLPDCKEVTILASYGEGFDADIRNMTDSIIKNNSDIVMYDVKHALKYLGIRHSGNIWDIGVAAYLINPLKDSYEPDDIARDYLGLTIPSYSEKFGKDSVSSLLENKPDEYEDYAASVCAILPEAMKEAVKKLEEWNMYGLYTDIEMPLVYTLNNMELEGIGADREALKRYGDSLTQRIDELEKEIYHCAGEEFNINSPKQLGVILFDKLKLPFAKKTKTGYSTSADILDKLRLEDPIVPAVLEYRQLTKLKSTYADGLAVYIRDDGRIHGTFNQTITATGRISSTEPNLQNIPIRMELGRQIRKVFVPKEGCVFLDADYSQIELRVLAHMSGDESLIQAYNENQDIHRITASKVFHVPFEEVTPELRRNAKAVNFGIVYGISSFGLGQDLNISKKDAEGYIKRYFETYPKIKQFLDSLIEDAKKTGYSVTEFGRRRPVPELSSSNFMQRSFGERVAMNSPIQGTAADIIKIAMINVEKKLEENNMRTRIVLQVHDELLLEAPEDEIEEASKLLREEMTHAVSLTVSMDVSVEQGSSWYEAK